MDDGVCDRLGDREMQVVQEPVWDTVRPRELHRGVPHTATSSATAGMLHVADATDSALPCGVLPATSSLRQAGVGQL